MEAIKIRPPKYSRKEGVGGISAILQPHFILYLVGKPGSGKSHLIYELVTNPSLYYKKFNRVFFCSPYEIPGLAMAKDNWQPYFDLDWLYQQVTSQPSGSNVLIILDDVIADIKKEQNNPKLMKLIFNRRHLIPNGTISYVIAAQKYIVCPTRIRSCLTALVVFKTNPNDWRKIKEENCYFDKALEGHIISNVYSKPYSFLYMRLDNGDIYQNFEKPLL